MRRLNGQRAVFESKRKFHWCRFQTNRAFRQFELKVTPLEDSADTRSNVSRSNMARRPVYDNATTRLCRVQFRDVLFVRFVRSTNSFGYFGRVCDNVY